ncbi:hypothetical protein [Kitasatospora sp. NPDC085464]|uniref:hypothetical protein n=1 Tax=Kitasatospora sp. NPDC085464 TaxID=3364063 RepID=UPI0037CC2AB9
MSSTDATSWVLLALAATASVAASVAGLRSAPAAAVPGLARALLRPVPPVGFDDRGDRGRRPAGAPPARAPLPPAAQAGPALSGHDQGHGDGHRQDHGHGHGHQRDGAAGVRTARPRGDPVRDRTRQATPPAARPQGASA